MLLCVPPCFALFSAGSGDHRHSLCCYGALTGSPVRLTLLTGKHVPLDPRTIRTVRQADVPLLDFARNSSPCQVMFCQQPVMDG